MIIKTSIIAMASLFFLGCTSSGDSNSAPSLPIAGTWASECMNFGSGPFNKIYAHVASDGKVYTAVLTYSSSGCGGSFSVSDTEGNPITVVPQSSTMQLENVSGVPQNFYVLNDTATDGSGTTYLIATKVDADTIGVLTDFPSPHSSWSEWLTENDVPGFYADPVNYVSGNKLILHSTTRL